MTAPHYACGCWRARCCRPAAGQTGKHCGVARHRCDFPRGTIVPAKGTAPKPEVRERQKPGPKPGYTPNVSPVTRRRREEKRRKKQDGDGNSK